jgi:hypothetical protein
MKSKIKFLLIPAIFGSNLINSCIHSKDEYGCREYKLMLKENISSVITKKYIDTVNHNFKTIEFFDIDGNKVAKILLEEYGKMYQIINVGDSLIKKPDDDMYTIISNGNFKRLRFNNFCKNKNQ